MTDQLEGDILTAPRRRPVEADPAIAAVERWHAARAAENAYLRRLEGDWSSDPVATANSAASDAAYWEMARTKPSTIEGMSLMFRAWAFDLLATNAGAVPEKLETWADQLSIWHDRRDVVLLMNMIGDRE